jgi:hypothetical protein
MNRMTTIITLEVVMILVKTYIVLCRWQEIYGTINEMI